MALRVYSVHRRRPAELELVKEGFCWPAFLFGPLWCAARREWLGLAAWLAAALVLGAGAGLTLAEPAQLVVALGFSALVGCAANDWRRWRLARAGWRLTDVVAAASLAEAEEKLAQEGRLAEPARVQQPPSTAGWPRAGAAPLDPFLP
jgi:hypothetical protein